MKRVKSFPIVTDEEDIVADVAAVRDQAKKATKKAAKKGKDTASKNGVAVAVMAK